MIKVKSRNELEKLIGETIDKEGTGADLNFIDTSSIRSMSCLFQYSKFNGKIDKWDTSKVTNMTYMFERSDFNGDISGS